MQEVHSRLNLKRDFLRVIFEVIAFVLTIDVRNFRFHGQHQIYPIQNIAKQS